MFEDWQASDFDSEFYMELLRAYFDSANDAIFVLCDEMKFLSCNKETQLWLGQSEKELTLHNQRLPLTQLLGSKEAEDVFITQFQQALKGKRVSFETLIKPENGLERWIEINMTRVNIESGDMIIAIARDISVRKKHLATIEYQTYYDSLTELPNKNYLIEYLSKIVSNPEINSLTLITLDLDRFKEINETLGQHLGDMILIEVAHRLGRIVDLEKDELLTRMAGNEFSLCIPNITTTQAKTIAHNIKEIIYQAIQLDKFSLNLDCGIGIATYPEHSKDIYKLIQFAESAMYTAKAHRMGINVYDKKSAQINSERLKLVGDLKLALDQNKITVHYQPIINMHDKKDIHLEVLARWEHPDLGDILPETFVWLAEESGLINLLTSKIMSMAISDCSPLLQRNLITDISINMSPYCLSNPKLPAELARNLIKHSISPECITLEITESAMMANTPKSEIIIQKLLDLGIKMSVDDFGTGHSSLYKLKQLPLSELKIDKAFVLELAAKQEDTEIIKATIQMSHGLGLKTVAEGIEDKATYNIIKSLGCDYAQGFYIARPMPFDKVEHWLGQFNIRNLG